MAEGKKLDTGKLRYDLVPPWAFEELVTVYTLGAKKYDDNNYRLGLNWSRVYAALIRHVEAWRKGEERDQVDGQLHLASVAWAALTLMEYGRMRKEFDDRPIYWEEQWKPVTAFPAYEVSDCGRARKSGKIINPQDNGRGYKAISFYDDGYKGKEYMHRLVFEAFVRPLGDDEHINHRDSDRGNNWLGNLEAVTVSGNMIHSYQQGRERLRPGEPTTQAVPLPKRT